DYAYEVARHGMLSVLISNFPHWMSEPPPKSQPHPSHSGSAQRLSRRMPPLGIPVTMVIGAATDVLEYGRRHTRGSLLLLFSGLGGNVTAQLLHHMAMPCQLDQGRIDLGCGLEAQVDEEDILPRAAMDRARFDLG